MCVCVWGHVRSWSLSADDSQEAVHPFNPRLSGIVMQSLSLAAPFSFSWHMSQSEKSGWGGESEKRDFLRRRTVGVSASRLSESLQARDGRGPDE